MKTILDTRILITPLFLVMGCSREEEVIDTSQLVERSGVYYKLHSQQPFQGKSVSYYENGRKKEDATYRDGKQLSVSSWYENGQQESEIKEDGTYTLWYENGRKNAEVNRDGTYTLWFENGQKNAEVKKNGTHIRWYKNGQKESEINEDGTYSMWDENGQKESPISWDE